MLCQAFEDTCPTSMILNTIKLLSKVASPLAIARSMNHKSLSIEERSIVYTYELYINDLYFMISDSNKNKALNNHYVFDYEQSSFDRVARENTIEYWITEFNSFNEFVKKYKENPGSYKNGFILPEWVAARYPHWKDLIQC